MRGWPMVRGGLSDRAVATGVLVLVVVGSLRPLIDPGREPWAVTLLSSLLILVGGGALYAGSRFPLAAALVSVAATAAHYLVSAYDGPLMVAPVVALYMIAAQGRLQAAVAVGALIVILTGIGTLAGAEDVNGVAVFMLAGWVIAMVALGWVRHSRRVYLREAEQRAAGEERLRIARELHDVAGHHISLINVQAGTALHRFRRDPAQAEAALRAIKDTSRDALRDLRATIGVLRGGDDGDPPTTPAPGLDGIGELVESARAAGLTVRTRLTGGIAGGARDGAKAGAETGIEADPADDAKAGVDGTAVGGGTLPAGVELAAYRIVQESLTNVVRHASATTVTVGVERRPEEVVVEVADDGRGPSSGTVISGSGIAGMRERARALGGELTVGPGPDGGFLVRARLPLGNGAS